MNGDHDFIALLACPACKASVKEEGQELVCQNEPCSLQYPVRDGIPVMLIHEAKKKKNK